jgi:hypothetical protein
MEPLFTGFTFSLFKNKMCCEMNSLICNHAAANHPLSRWQPRLTALVEVCGVYMLGLLLAFLMINLSGMDLQNPLEVLKTDPNADCWKCLKVLVCFCSFNMQGLCCLLSSSGGGIASGVHPAMA